MELPHLLELVKREFDSRLEAVGYVLASCRLVGAPSFREGFAMVYSNAASTCTIDYGDLEFVARLDGLPLFDSAVHPGFSGNMFSREHLAEHIAHIATVVCSAIVTESHAV